MTENGSFYQTLLPKYGNDVSFGSAVFLSEYETMNKAYKSKKYWVQYTLSKWSTLLLPNTTVQISHLLVTTH